MNYYFYSTSMCTAVQTSLLLLTIRRDRASSSLQLEGGGWLLYDPSPPPVLPKSTEAPSQPTWGAVCRGSFRSSCSSASWMDSLSVQLGKLHRFEVSSSRLPVVKGPFTNEALFFAGSGGRTGMLVLQRRTWTCSCSFRF